ncbi:ABC-2 type transport system permease protein [Marinimicrobium koreense]|uniref:ABC-2 type transport system permease protein n=1 Tax=Marinimicrobium koreense TaxID=306545 RepID=A0A3N1NPQ9_9GAMM|nr:hypothetical protein [Marinimicrobium koreense]ROQ21744.1 ABC-2 type transport system permease protein [Marinimicrobium koreense]
MNPIQWRPVWMQCQREFWESRGTFLRTPLWVAAVIAALMVMGMITGNIELNAALNELRGAPENLQKFEDGADLVGALMSGDLFSTHPQVLRAALAAIAIPFILTLLLVSQVYLLGSLYSDRRDKSILFWKSLPVSETRVVLTKLAFGALVGPGIFIGASLLVGLLHLLMLLGYISWQLGVDLPDMGSLIGTFLGHSLALVSGWLQFSLWFLPLWAWLLLASAYAKKSPFLVAFGVPAVAMVLELWILRSVELWQAIWVPTHRSFEGLVRAQAQPEAWLSQWGETLSEPAFWAGLVVAAGFTIAAIWLRNYRYEL